MKIKNVREPSEKEKTEIIPLLITMGISTALITGVIYLCCFHFKEIGESLYAAEKILSSRSAAYQNLIAKFFETIYSRDYMLSKFEGIPISLMLSVVTEVIVGIAYKANKTLKGLK